MPAVAIVLAGLLQAAPPAVLLAAPESSPSGRAAWLRRGPGRDAEAVAAAYQQGLREAHAARFGDDVDGFRRWQADASQFRYTPGAADLFVMFGEFAGHWHFIHPGDGRWPRAAVRWQVDPESPYRVGAEVWCDAGAFECAAADAWLDALPAPRPTASAPEAVAQEWRGLVVTESCVSTRTVGMPAPRYPPTEERLGVGGRVVLGLVFNPCGDVRDAWVVATSGHRSLDRAAVRTALGWRVRLTSGAVKGGYAKVPITFEMAPDEADPTP